jgi:hypothetical protein
MARSQNGWPANDRSVIATRTVRGTHVRLAVRVGPAGDLLLEIVALFDLMVQDVDQGADDWGYAERPIRGATALSNHASGTAVDVNATRWPLGSAPSVNLTPRQIATVREIVSTTVVDGRAVVRWGGDYAGRKDPMHFEIADGATEAECARALAQLRARYGNPGGQLAAGEDDVSPELEQMIREIHAESTKRLDNRRGPQGATIPDGGADTVLGYAANADGIAFRTSWAISDLHDRVDDLVALINQRLNAAGAGVSSAPVQLDYRALAAELLRQMAGAPPQH